MAVRDGKQWRFAATSDVQNLRPPSAIVKLSALRASSWCDPVHGHRFGIALSPTLPIRAILKQTCNSYVKERFGLILGSRFERTGLTRARWLG